MPDFSAKTVLNQLGGRKFIAMTGARNFVKDEKNKSIGFKIPKAKDKINYVKITLNAMDTYDMEFGKIVKFDYHIVKKVHDVYYDQLQETFTQNTGLNTSL